MLNGESLNTSLSFSTVWSDFVPRETPLRFCFTVRACYKIFYWTLLYLNTFGIPRHGLSWPGSTVCKDWKQNCSKTMGLSIPNKRFRQGVAFLVRTNTIISRNVWRELSSRLTVTTGFFNYCTTELVKMSIWWVDSNTANALCFYLSSVVFKRML